MKVNQIAGILNTTLIPEYLGESDVVVEDLSNIVDIGHKVTSSTTFADKFDNFVKTIFDKVGKVIIDDKLYETDVLGLMRDSWEYGSILEKIRIQLPEFSENNSWNLNKGTKYDDILIFEPPAVSVKIWNKRSTYQTKFSLSYETVKSAFRSAGDMSRFFAGIENRVRTLLNMSNHSLAKRCLNNMIAQKFNSNNNVINLLAMYKAESGDTTLTASTCINDKEFLRFASAKIKEYSDYMTEMSMLFNDDGYPTHSPKNEQLIYMLTRFTNRVESVLQSDTFHDELVKLPNFYGIPAWQGMGTDDTFPFETISKIDVSIELENGETTQITKTGVIGCIVDKWGVGINNYDYRVTSFFNPENETTKFYHKVNAQYFNDLGENCVVFVVADVTE